MDKVVIPHNVEAEKALLGAILIVKDKSIVIDEVNQIIKSTDFYRKANQVIYLTILDLFNTRKDIDSITLTEKLTNTNQLESVGGIAYITDLSNCVPSAVNIKSYANIVRENAIKRELINAGQKIIQQAQQADGNVDINSVLDNAEKDILEIAKTANSTDKIIEPAEYIIKAFTEIESRYNSNKDGKLFGLDTGFSELNRMTGGLQKSDLIILGARPSMGKTAFVLNILANLARKNIPVAIFSLEMSAEQLTNRLFSLYGLINSNSIRLGKLDGNDLERLTLTASILSEKPLYIDDTAGLNISELRNKARKLKREKDIQLLAIDYLQLMQGTSKKDRQQEISEISRQLKLLARELNITIIALSQLSRAVEARQDKRPMLSDIRESGAIEQDADIVMFLYRDEYYNADTKNKGLTELIIAKHRNGAIGKINLKFSKQFCLFENLI
ncbi:replicative DNA helicase [Megamonas funiformis]|uniref:replicative DNA helicase n=1 Tax=Megamonas funiformis TaxID=437897 RepID=UPI002942F528|nr:replicative DNA helicase [Megamonas funiformis]